MGLLEPSPIVKSMETVVRTITFQKCAALSGYSALPPDCRDAVEQVPSAPLRLVGEILAQAGGHQILVVVAQLVNLSAWRQRRSCLP
jgi:hypothetical protein